VQRTVVALVQNRPGALNRTVSLLRGRDVRIGSLAIGESETPGVRRMTVVVDVDDAEQVVKQLNRLIEVLEVKDVTHAPIVERETALIKINAPESRRGEIQAAVECFGGRIIDTCADTLIAEMTDTPARLAALIESVRPFGVREMMRSGRLALTIGALEPNAERQGALPTAEDTAAAVLPWWAQADGIA
jgi:acetolactate synthase-1/3 small subunit